ncbi:hypothetical protein HPB52_010884 [Rhipicephalus sanguineus]|uniref:Uncharacterized protein n=1 Tax=Rhipicephalus sanguineus TaxID=34632 RepID=A0A9D4SPK7_RHISA|nr:hypothetical protein HPB52_010884 [Rhipicephalus sanguineus]
MADPACHNESCAYQWKSQLDMDKPCGAVSSEETCWLCHDLTAWNRVMNVLALVLEESRPGMLLLRCSVEKKPDSEQVTAARQASFLASWLLRHHPLLASSQSRAEQIVLPDIGELSLDSVSAIFNALALNKRVNHLDIAVKQEPDARVALLCETLKKNGSMKHFTIVIENVDSGTEILRALAANAAVSFLYITLRMVAIEKTTEAFSDMLSRNNAITSIVVDLYGEGAQQFLDLIVKAMSGNKLIVSFISRVGYYTYVPTSILESVRRNKCALNRAVEFVLQRRDDRRGGECFELFAGRPCLTTHLIEVAGITDADAQLKVVAAEHRIQEKYFILTDIVRHSMVCWPAGVTQFDALNRDCCRAISRYLRLTDPPSEMVTVPWMSKFTIRF